MGRYVYIWEYRVKPSRLAEFERVYGAEGEWVALFRRAEGYLSTELHRDLSDATRFVTIDTWSSREAWQAFRTSCAREFERLDRQCESLTTMEREVGCFEALG